MRTAAWVFLSASLACAMARRPAGTPYPDTVPVGKLHDVEYALGTTFQSIERTPIEDSLPVEWEAVGVHWYRNEINWKDCVIGKAEAFAFPSYTLPGNPRPIEAFFDSLKAHRIEPYVLLNGGDPLYGPLEEGASRFDPRKPEANALSPDGFARFCAAFAARYRDRVRYFELGNEPHNYLFWEYFAGPEDRSRGRVWGPHFAAYFNAGAAAVKREYPNAKILSPGEDDGGLDAFRDYFPAIAGSVDVLAIHPYVNDVDPTPEGSYAYAVEPFQRLAERYGIHETWITELGWQAPADGPPADFSERGRRTTALGQAKYLCRSLFFYPIRCGIKVVTQFCWTGGDPGWQIRAPAKRALRNLHDVIKNSAVDPRLSAFSGTTAHFDLGAQAAYAPGIERYLLIKSDKSALLAFWFRTAQQDAYPKRPVSISLALPGRLRIRSARSHDPLDGSAADVHFAAGPSALTLKDTWIADYPNLIEIELK